MRTLSVLWSGVLMAAVLAGCPEATFLEPYYPNFRAPGFDGFDVASEPGNSGGREVTITGSGFGTDPAGVVVLFDHHNATILDVTDSTIRLVTPVGPITGGAADLIIATDKGYVEVPDAYTYDMGTLSQDSGFYDDERYYVLVSNYWQSCLGGAGPSGCESVSYFGDVGLDGRAEFFRPAAVYPRIHTAYQGFVTAADESPLAWHVTEGFEQPFPSGVDDLRKRVDRFTLRNPALEGEGYCYDLAGVPTDGEARNCDGQDVREYDLGTLQFCEGDDAETGGNYTYTADWPVLQDFFEANGDHGETDVQLDIPELGLADEPLTLPPEMVITPSVGIEGDYIAWANGNFKACGDGNGDGEATLDESGLNISWRPIDPAISLGGGDHVLSVDTYVHVSVSRLNVGWFSGDGWGLRASVVVPDTENLDESTGRSHVEIPNSVLYQFPSPNFQWSNESQISSTGYLGTFDSGASYMLIEILRVTDYRIQTDDGILVFSYVTGDLTFPQYKNVTEQTDDCHDCLDGDGDGWTDSADPDCADDGTTEENPTSSYTCNDGLDNDGNGDIDAADEKCATGLGGETNCGDGVDNDEDGWVDGKDGECNGDPFAQELGDDDESWTCSDGVDDDSDGWVDAEDPACTVGSDTEDDGFSGTACNNDIDDDGNGDVDSLDPYCSVVGATGTSEQPTYITQCIDANDNDGDGYVDRHDPDCEYPPHSRETQQFHDPAVRPLTATCYDGLDNDGDGALDADDPSCWDPDAAFVADGFRDESTNTNDCSDGIDGDDDGWIDGSDPDCKVGDASHQTEVGLGTTQCNDGIDNNHDDKIDSESPYCKTGHDNFEGP